jgi:hypothetical protein
MIEAKRYRLELMRIKLRMYEKANTIPREQLFDGFQFFKEFLHALVDLKEACTKTLNGECNASNPDDNPLTRIMHDFELTREAFAELLQYIAGILLAGPPFPSLFDIYDKVPERVREWLWTPDLVLAARLPD